MNIIIMTFLLTIIAMFIVSKFNISILGIKISFTKNKNFDKINELVDLVKNYNLNIVEVQKKILKNELFHMEGVLLKIEDQLILEITADKIIISQKMAHDYLKNSIINNNFNSLDRLDFIDYINVRVLALKQIYRKILGESCNFIEGQVFDDYITDIFTHANECYRKNSKDLADNTIQYQLNYNKLIKLIRG